jgi:hypothetical protein
MPPTVGAATVMVAFVAVIWPAVVGVASISRSRSVIAARTAVIARSGIIAISHVDIRLGYDGAAGRVSVVAVIRAVTVAIHGRAVRVDRTAAKESGEEKTSQCCKALHFKDQCVRITL